MKKLLIAIISLAFLTSCAPNEEETRYDFKDPKTELKNTEVDIKIDQVLLDGGTLSFDLYLERPELNLKAQDYEGPGTLTVDLPLELQPRLMYAIDTDEKEFDMGPMCDRPRFPHRCDIRKDEGKEFPTQYKITIVFEDETYAEKIIEIPIPEKLETPKIVAPTSTPAQNSKFSMSFKDIGADTYEVSMYLCIPYNNDGINPCLNGDEHIIKRQEGKLRFYNDTSTSKPMIEEKNGIVTVTSYYPINFSESVEYMVIAHKTGEIEDKSGNKIPTYLTSSSSVSFK